MKLCNQSDKAKPEQVLGKDCTVGQVYFTKTSDTPKLCVVAGGKRYMINMGTGRQSNWLSTSCRTKYIHLPDACVSTGEEE